MAPTFVLSTPAGGGAVALRGQPGRLLHGAIRVRNLSGQAITVIMQTADIETASNGSAEFVTGHPAYTGRWLGLAAHFLHLPPHVSVRVPFTVNVPVSAGGGAHYGGIVAFDAADLHTVAARKAAHGKLLIFYRVNRQAVPVTIRLPGALTPRLRLDSVKLAVQPAGARLALGLQPGGDELIQGARVNLRVMRGARTVFRSATTLGQLFPGSTVDYEIPWVGRPTQGSYRVVGVVAPEGLPALAIDQSIHFTAEKAAKLARVTPPIPTRTTAHIPGWVWGALAAAAVLLMTLLLITWRLVRRSRVRPAM